MSKILIRNTCIEIHDYNLGDCPRLERNFLVWSPTSFSSYPLGMDYNEEEKILYIPRGVDIWYLENLFECKASVDYNNYYPYDRIQGTKLKYKPRDNTQVEALKFLTGEGQYNNSKTYSSIASIAYYGVKSLIITYAVDWLHQWKKCFCEYTNFKPEEVYIIEGSVSINKLMRYGSDKYKAFLITHSSIKSFGDNRGWDVLAEFIKSLKVGICVFDEAHLNFANMMKFSFSTNIWKTFYVTASPLRSDESENEIYAKSFKNVPSIELFDEENDPHTDYIAMLYNSHPTAQEVSDCRNAYGLDRNKYTNYLVTKPNYYKLLRILLDISWNIDGKSLYYIGTNSAILETKRWIEVNVPFLRDYIGVYTSITPKELKKAQLDKKIILSTTKSCGAAVDIKGLKLTVVLNEPFKSPVLAQQTLGRTRDNNTKYIDTVDLGFKQTRKYYKQKLNIFNKYAKSMTEVNISDAELDKRLDTIMERLQSQSNAMVYINKEVYFMLPREDEYINYNEPLGEVDIL